MNKPISGAMKWYSITNKNTREFAKKNNNKKINNVIIEFIGAAGR